MLSLGKQGKLWTGALGVLLLLCLVTLSWSGLVFSATDEQAAAEAQLAEQSDGTLTVEIYLHTGAARWVAAEGGVLTREFARQALAPEAVARAFLDRYGALFGLSNPAARLQQTRVEDDTLGNQQVRFQQMENGITVFGTDLIVHLNSEGAVTLVNGYTAPSAMGMATTPALTQEGAAGIAQKLVAAPDSYAAEGNLVLLNPGLITDQATPTYLTYRLRIDSPSQPHLAEWIFVDAQSGEVRFRYPAITDGRNRSTYNMKRGTSYTSATLARSETQGPVSSATNCTAADVNNAHNYAGNTYDFYFNRFNRDSYNNAGAALRSYVCYGVNYQNAFWDGSRMTYGDGFASADDVVAHELSHAVTEYTSNLVYSNQSGALNESFSDIFGEAVDLTNGSGTDTATVRWDMGENIPGIGAIRDMMDPTRFGDPDRTGSTNYYCGTGDNGGVHINSGVPNKAFALMVDGGTFNGKTITAIGIDQAVQVAYRTNATYLTSSAKMLDAYNGFIRSCSDLYGATSATCTAVKNAVEATQMNGPICGTGGATPTPSGPTPTRTATRTPTRTPTPGGPTPTPTRTPVPPTGLVNGDFESGRNVGWTEYSALGYVLVAAGYGENSSWGAWLGGLNNETSEISQRYTVPTAGGTLYYRYRITSSDLCGYDYGYVRVNSSTRRTYQLCSTNATNGFVQGSISLATYAGQTVTLRFRSVADSSLTSSFFIDNVRVAAGALAEEADLHAGEEIAAPAPKVESAEGGFQERLQQRQFLPLVIQQND
jgi:Zn-dependent metalloprotease